MKKFTVLILGLCLAIGLSLALTAAEKLDNPYEILNKYYEAMGGLEKFKSQKSIYSEGNMEIVGAGMSGLTKSWEQYPIYKRIEMNLGTIKMIHGDNGKYSWVLDVNGKVEQKKDDKTLKSRQLETYIANFEHLNPNSKIFKITFEGIEKVNTRDCYVVKITNTVNNDIRQEYYAVSDFQLLKQIEDDGDNSSSTYYSDYREVEGILRAFQMDMAIPKMGTKMKINLDKYVINPEIEPAMFEPPGTETKDYAFTNGNKSENVPFKFLNNHLVLEVELGGKKNLWVVDTGASRTVIDRDVAVEMGLELEGDMKGQGAGNTISVSFVKLPPFSILGIKFETQKVSSTKLRELIHSVMGLDAIGVLGYDFMSRFVTRIDYAGETLSFYDPADFKYTGDGKVLDIQLDNNLITVPMTVDNKYTGRWRLDTGAGSTIFHYPFAKENGFFKRKTIDLVGSGAGGRISMKATRFDSAQLAGFTIADPTISFPSEPSGMLAIKSLIGNLGNDILHRFVIFLDYKNRKMIVEKGSDFDTVLPVEKSGLMIGYNDNEKIIVSFVADGTPAKEAGFKEHDIIEKINKKPVAQYGDLETIRRLFQDTAGTKFTFVIERDKKPLQLKMVLRKYL
ncbi:MAG: PDZ domain-containing protein [bacterium]|nr:PDZ domain-containing protein [bacterium]